MSLADLGNVAVAGTKFKANAGHHEAMSYAQTQTAKSEVQAKITASEQKTTHADKAEGKGQSLIRQPRSSQASFGHLQLRKLGLRWREVMPNLNIDCCMLSGSKLLSQDTTP